MGISGRRLLQVGLIVGMAVAATASPLSVSAKSTHDVVRYERKNLGTLPDGTRVDMETLVVAGQHSKELNGVKDWKAYSSEQSLQVTTTQANAGYFDRPYWYTAGCRITGYNSLSENWHYQVTHDYAYSYYIDTISHPYIAAEGGTYEAWSTYLGWNMLSHSIGPRYVMWTTTLGGKSYPYQEYLSGSYNVGHGVTTPWGSIIIESHAGNVKPIYGPEWQVQCQES